MTDKIATFVFEGIEVKLTGRTANKPLKAAVFAKKDAPSEPKMLTLHEITPVDSFGGEWKKWVRREELYEVKDES